MFLGRNPSGLVDQFGTPYGVKHNNNRLVVYPATEISAFGELVVVNPHPIFQGSFEYTVDNTTLTTNTAANGGTIIQADAMAVIGTSTTTASTAELRTLHHARYRSGQGGKSMFTALFDAPVDGTEQYMGIMDEAGSVEAYKNGYGIGYDGFIFGVHRWQNDVKTTVALADCDDPLNGSGASGMKLDPTKLNVFQIKFQYLGGGAIHYYIEDSITSELIKFHTVHYSNSSLAPSVYNPNFHFTMWVNNGATTEDIVLKCGSYSYFVEGISDLIEVHQPQYSSGEKIKLDVTTEVAILTIRNKALYASKTNFIDILVENIGASIEASSANNLGSIRLVKNATLGGTPIWNDISATDSVVEVDVVGTTVTGGIELFTVPLAGKNDKVFNEVTGLKIILHDSETLTLAGSSENTAVMRGSSLWKELF